MAGTQNIEMSKQEEIERYNRFLDGLVRGGGSLANWALGELSGRALGNSDAQLLIRKIDSDYASGQLTLSAQEEPVVRPVGLVHRIKRFFSKSAAPGLPPPPDRDPMDLNI